MRFDYKDARTYTNTPIRINFLSVGCLRSKGNVLMAPALPIDDLDGTVNRGL
jgi:hypothetical protein